MERASSWKKRILFLIVTVIFCVSFVIVNQFEKEPLTSTDGQSYEKAVVTSITKDNLEDDGERYGDQEVIVKIKSGSLKGQEIEATSPNGTLFGAACTIGMKVIVIVSVSGDTNVVTVYAQDRSIGIYAFILIFALIICLVGGKKGVKSVASLAFTFICILYFMFPLIYRGFSPILVTIGISVLASIVTLGFIGGFTHKTLAALIGTTCGVAIAGVVALIFGESVGINGYNVSDIETLNYVAQSCPIKIGELLFAGIIISSLGAVMDVGMSIASTIQEIHDRNPELKRSELFVSGIHVGRDMMGTMTNTLILAYVGGSITTLITNYAYDLSYNQLLNSYNIGIEIMQGLSGSLGVVLTVPITAAISSTLLISRKEK